MPIVRRLLETIVGAILSAVVFNVVNLYFKRYDELQKKRVDVIEAVIIE